MQILFASDGSPSALSAAGGLCALPLEAQDTVTVLTVAETGHEQQAVDGLRASREALGHCTATVKTELRHGHPADTILHAAEELHPDLLVLGATGRSAIARFLIGSVAERVARHAPCSVLVVRPGLDAIRRVLVGLDSSASSADAAVWLQRFPLPDDVALRLVNFVPNLHEIVAERVVVEPPLAEHAITLADWLRDQAHAGLERVAADLERAGYRATTEIHSGDPAVGLIQAAADGGADLVVAATRGHGPVERLLAGSVTDTLLRHAPCSVLVIKSHT